jgi:RNA polymerase sigma-70 factor, ECF subfamily
VHAICRRVVPHPEDALDATQNALIAVARGISRFDGRSAFTTWLYRVTMNAALDELRRRARRPIPVETLPEAVTPEAATGAVEARVDLDRALGAIPIDYRVAVVMRDLGDLDYAEIAAVLDLPVGTVRSRISRGRDALAAILGNPSRATRRPSEQR